MLADLRHDFWDEKYKINDEDNRCQLDAPFTEEELHEVCLDLTYLGLGSDEFNFLFCQHFWSTIKVM
jgi:hypothetical protein